MGVALRLGELHLVHTLTNIPMHVRSTFVHGRELEGTFVVGQSPAGEVKLGDVLCVFFSGSSLKRAPRSGFNPMSVLSTRVVKILHTSPGSFLHSTSASNQNGVPLSALPPLPDQSEWRQMFNASSGHSGLRERISVSNPEIARALADEFTSWTKPFINTGGINGNKSVSKGAPKSIIGAFPGTPQTVAFPVTSCAPL